MPNADWVLLFAMNAKAAHKAAHCHVSKRLSLRCRVAGRVMYCAHTPLNLTVHMLRMHLASSVGQTQLLHDQPWSNLERHESA